MKYTKHKKYMQMYQALPTINLLLHLLFLCFKGRQLHQNCFESRALFDESCPRALKHFGVTLRFSLGYIVSAKKRGFEEKELGVHFEHRVVTL
jgi:hypothetical protein